MKLTKKISALLLAAVMLFGMISLTASAKTSEEADTHLQYNEDGSFKIMQITDFQDTFPMKYATKVLLRAMLEQEQPDLVILTGDNICGGSVTKIQAKNAINEFMSIFEEYGYPVAMTFGNHDTERTNAYKDYQLSVYESYDCFIGCAGEYIDDASLCTYYIPVYSSTDANKMVNNLWLLDAGTMNEGNKGDNKGHYSCASQAMVDWYVSTSERLEQENGHKVPSLMFQHIIVPEIYDALVKVEPDTEGAIKGKNETQYYILPEDAVGVMHEAPCPSRGTEAIELDAILERGDVVAMFTGHDHINSFEVNYKGIWLCSTASAGFRPYNDETVGCRIITLDESDPWSFETQAKTYFDYFDYDDDEARYLYKMSSDTSSFATKFACFFKYIWARIA